MHSKHVFYTAFNANIKLVSIGKQTYFNSLSASLLLNISLSFEVGIARQLPTSNERKIPPHFKIKPAKFHNGGFTQDLYMHICSISVKF